MKINIIVNGNKCKQYSHNNRIFIEAKNGSEYSIEIENTTFQRKLVVSSVDGLNVINGEPCTEKDSGYIISPYSKLRIDGFRISNEEVAKFKFTTKNNSYAATKGDPEIVQNVGVIGVLVYSEYIPPQPVYKGDSPIDWMSIDYSVESTPSYSNPTYSSNVNTGDNSLYDSGPLRSADSSARRISTNTTTMKCSYEPGKFDMGTTWGSAKKSKVVDVPFTIGSLFFESSIFYASREELIKMGVPLENEKEVCFPKPFTKKFASPPPGWTK